MRVAGLDLSTRALDFCVLDPDNPADCEHRRVELPSPWWDAARGMSNPIGVYEHPFWTGVSGWLDEPVRGDYRSKVALLGIERPYGPSRQAIASLHTILGAVLATIPSHITVLEVRPAEMRRHLGLKGNVSKERMHVEIQIRIACGDVPPFADAREYSDDAHQSWKWPPDALDAWAVAWAAYRMCQDAAERAA